MASFFVVVPLKEQRFEEFKRGGRGHISSRKEGSK